MVISFILSMGKQQPLWWERPYWYGTGSGGNENNHWDWGGNDNETWLNLGSKIRMGMNHWERERLGSKKTFPLISNMGEHC